MNEHEKLNYVEFPAADIPATKRFFQQAFSWTFENFGPEYCAFSDQGLDGGFYNSDLTAVCEKGSALLIFYSRDLEATLKKVVNAGGIINRPIYSFPGGSRFHFIEPSGNEFAVWSEVSA